MTVFSVCSIIKMVTGRTFYPAPFLFLVALFYPIVLFTWKQSRSMGSALIAKGGIIMANKIAVINLKGGVGKTTTAVGVSTVLSGAYRKRVLLIDLDPQTNATIMLIGEENWKDLNKAVLPSISGQSSSAALETSKR